MKKLTKLNNKCIMVEVRKPDRHWLVSEEHKVTKVWYSWNPTVFMWIKNRQDGPAWIDCHSKVWYDRGSIIKRV